jgi:hypothetical protein
MFSFCSMVAAPALADLETAKARVGRLCALLAELSGMGMDLVRALHGDLMNGGRAADAVAQFCRLAKAIRQLVALEFRLTQALADVESGRWAAEEAERGLRALAAQARRDAAVEAVGRAVREAGDSEAIERLTERLDDWHAERAVERDFSEKSVTEIVIGACQGMGLVADPALLAGEEMSETLADAVRAYAAARQAAPHGAEPEHRADERPPPPPPNALAEPRPPPG